MKDVADRLKKVRCAEARQKKQHERRKPNKSFKTDPCRATKNVGLTYVLEEVGHLLRSYKYVGLLSPSLLVNLNAHKKSWTIIWNVRLGIQTKLYP